ncbi:MAG TPA: hypothetical protein VFF00_10335 [Candidatus Elarobacter sp.]|nr:hypothetical protein [Candidatus Elarobacter sp.]
MMEHAGGVDDVEGAGLETRPIEIGLDELDALEPEASRGRCAQQERGARQVGADDDAIRARQIQAQLTGPAADLDDAGVSGDGPIEQLRERVLPGPEAERVKAVARWIAGERRALVKPAHRFGAFVGGEAQVWDAVGRVEATAARAAGQLDCQRTCARRAGEQLPKCVHQKMA